MNPNTLHVANFLKCLFFVLGYHKRYHSLMLVQCGDHARRCGRGSVQFHVLHGQNRNMLVPVRLMLDCRNLALLGFYLLCLG